YIYMGGIFLPPPLFLPPFLRLRLPASLLSSLASLHIFLTCGLPGAASGHEMRWFFRRLKIAHSFLLRLSLGPPSHRLSSLSHPPSFPLSLSPSPNPLTLSPSLPLPPLSFPHCRPGMLLDLLSPLVPSAFLPLLCLGSISRAITGTASGATRAALTQHFAKRQNAADISAKEGSQETAATMAGMLAGMVVGQLVAGNVLLLWAVFLSLTAFHVYEQPTTALHGRAHMLMGHVHLGARLSDLHSKKLDLAVRQAIRRYAKGRYLLVFKPTRSPSLQSHSPPTPSPSLQSQSPLAPSPSLPHVHAIIHRDASNADVLRAYIHALTALEEIWQEARNAVGSAGSEASSRLSLVEAAEARAAAWMASEYSQFLDKVSLIVKPA
ncbi:unnamed protein product, partial [Closterium sp. NIES-54]